MIKDTWDKNENASANKKEITVLKEHFPACFKENGSFDLERFKEYLSEDINVVNEGYELKFLGKNYARLLVTLETETVIVPNEEHNQKEENKDSENIYITGDNLDGLKHLLKSYAGKVKCIYIDPPYNTGSDGFVYNDNFNFTIEELTEKLSIGEEQAQRILDLTKRGSASHSAWLMFMYPRLQLARDLLSDDGVIFISIDDNEQANLKLLCDDIFGEDNFITNLIWQNKRGGGNDSTHVAVEHEYIIMIAKNKELLQPLFQKHDAEYLKRYNLKDEKGRYYWDTFKRKSGKQYYPIECPDGEILEYDEHGNPISWLRSQKRFEQDKKEGEIKFVKSKSGWSVHFKQRLPKGKKPRSLYEKGNIINEYGTTSTGSSKILELFNFNAFDNPKPVELIKFILEIIPSENEYIIDFFSGSATTAHATMELNNEDDGERKYIMVQLPEEIGKGSTAYKKGYKTIDELGRTRIKKAVNNLKRENPNTKIDLGFKHFTLIEPTSEAISKLVEFTPKKDEMIINNTILDEFGVPTVITTWLNNDGYGLTSEAEKIMFAGYEAYYKDKHLYLVQPELPNEAIEELVVKYETDGNFNPENIVLFGYSFTWTELESLKTNLKRLQDTEKNLRINFDVRY